MSSRALADIPPEIRIIADENSYNGSTNEIFYSSTNGGRVTLQPGSAMQMRKSASDRTPRRVDDVEKRVGKTTVFVQVVFMKLGEIDTVKETFTADVFIQARWREPKLDGSQNAREKDPDSINYTKYWNPKLYVDNTVGEPKETICHTTVYDTEKWEAYIIERRRVKGTFLENLELFTFPFDTQDITVTLLSERAEDELDLQDDPKQLSTINVESFVDEQEWRLYNEVVTFKGAVNKFYQGDSAENSTHPTISCRTHACRRPGFYVTNIFVVMFFICSMTFTTFSVDYIKRENRLQLTFILLLTTVTFKFAVNSQLPRISYLTTLDVYIMTSMTVLILMCVWHAIIPSIALTWKDARARNADFAVVIAFGTLFALVQIVFAIVIGIPALRRKWIFEEQERKHMKMLKKEKNRQNAVGECILQDIRRTGSCSTQSVTRID